MSVYTAPQVGKVPNLWGFPTCGSRSFFFLSLSLSSVSDMCFLSPSPSSSKWVVGPQKSGWEPLVYMVRSFFSSAADYGGGELMRVSSWMSRRVCFNCYPTNIAGVNLAMGCSKVFFFFTILTHTCPGVPSDMEKPLGATPRSLK